MNSQAREFNLAFCTSYEDETSANKINHTNTSKLEGIAQKGCRTMCEISAVTKFRQHSAAFGFATLAAEPSFSGSASDLVMF